MAATTQDGRRTPGTGTMRERPAGSGHWQLRAFLGPDAVTGKPRQVTKTFHGTEAKAKVELGRFVTEVTDGKFDSTTATVSQLLDKWLELIGQTRRPKTVHEYRSKIDRHVRPALGSIKLSKLRPDQLDALYASALGAGLSPTTVHHLHAILSAALRQGARCGWIAQAPTGRATPPQPVRKDMVVPTPKQLTTLVRAAEADDPVLGTAVALAALTGARRGELVALKWSDIDLTAGQVRIARSLTVAGGEHHTGPTKTHATRVVALDPVAVRVLQRRWAYMEDLAEQAGSPLVDDPYVLSYNANSATPVGPDTLTHGFNRVCVAMELPALKALRKVDPDATRTDLAPADRWPFRFHDLRHFSVTTLKMSDVAPNASFDTVRDHRPPGLTCPACGAQLPAAG